MQINVRTVRVVAASSLVLATGILIASAALQSFGGLAFQVFLTLAAIGIGGLVALVLLPELDGASKRLARLGVAALAISQLTFHALVWTGLTTESEGWRVWWVSSVVAVGCALAAWLRRSSSGRGDWIERGTPWAVVGLAVSVGGLGVLEVFPHMPGRFYQAVLLSFGAMVGVGTLVSWRRAVGAYPDRASMSFGAKILWLSVSHASLLLMGWYLGRAALPTPTPFENLPSTLVHLTPEELDTQLQLDLERLRTVVDGIDELSRAYLELDHELRQALETERRDYYLPEEEDRIRALFMTYLSYRSALLRIVATYASFEALPSERERARAFTLGFTAAMTTFKSSLQLINSYRDEVARLKLNEPEREWGIPAGMFDRIYEGVTNERNAELAMEMGAYFEIEREGWRAAGVWPAEDYAFLEARILDGFMYVREHGIAGRRARLELFLDRVQKRAYTPMYAAQSILAEWIGDTRISEQQPLIPVETVEAIESHLKPGDILLERRNWYLSNAFLPGFWPHAALYVGSAEDLRALGIADEPALRSRLDAFGALAADGRAHTVIESVSEGVIFNSLTESMHADYVAVLRPRLSDAEIGRAIVRAFRHHGKPYDFEFDFFTSDKIVCTELVYRAYDGMLDFDLVRVMGRDTLPALEIVRKYNRERGGDEQELDFVLFLDAEPGTSRVVQAGEDAFMASADRPSTFNK